MATELGLALANRGHEVHFVTYRQPVRLELLNSNVDTAAAPSSATATTTEHDTWWRDAVTYQVYIRSFADSDGDGLGDVSGIRSRLPYLAELGVDAIWINPWYPSPQADAGYDVSDYRDIDPAFGSLADAEALITDAHVLGLRVLLDIVPNHTSDEHSWFVEALAAGSGSSQRDRYVFRPGSGADGSDPPNDWRSVFGGPAWTRVTEADGTPGEWYLHLFDPKQPDLNWDNPQVRADFEEILRFWFDRGADGFRIDVAHGLVKDPDLPDLDGRDSRSGPEHAESHLLDAVDRPDHPHWDRPGVHQIYREWRVVGDSYNPPKIFVAEAWVAGPRQLAAYLRPDELHTAFDFNFVMAPWNARSLRSTATSSLLAHDQVGAPVMWVLSNHDISRHVTRLGRANARQAKDPLHGPVRTPSDPDLGKRRARAALLLELALPGGVYLYQGEELGLEEVEDLPEDLLQDPTWERSGRTERGRDGCRVPLPWSAAGPSLGFGAASGWLPQPSGWAGADGLSVQAQQEDPASMLSFYRTALHVRRRLTERGVLGAGSAASVQWLEGGDGAEQVGDVLCFHRGPKGAGVLCVVNTGSEPVDLPEGAVMLASGPLIEPDDGAQAQQAQQGNQTGAGQRRRLPGDTAVWLAC